MPIVLTGLTASSINLGVLILIIIGAVVACGGLLFAVFMTTSGKKKAQEVKAEEEQKADEQPAQEISEQTEVKDEQPAEATQEIAEEPAEVVEEAVEETEAEVEEEPAEEVAEEVLEEPEAAEETAEEPVEEIAEVAEESAEEPEAEPAEEPAVSEQVIASAVEETDEKDEPDEKDEKEEKEEEVTVKKVVREGENIRYIVIKYKKSFTAKLIQSEDGIKNYYSEIKNELLSYKGVKARMSWKAETFYSGRTTYAKMCIRGKNISLYLALDPKKYIDTKYIVDDMSDIAAHEKVPCRYLIKNDRRLKYSRELIAEVMGEREKDESYSGENWAVKYPYEPLEPLIERNLVKVLTDEDASSGTVFKPRNFVEAEEVDEIMQDEVAVALIEETEELSDKTKSAIVNIDTLSKHFESGETVMLEEIKKRIPKIPARTTYIKVLARGTLDKKLTVIADSYSIQAAKMILITGGNAIRKKNS